MNPAVGGDTSIVGNALFTTSITIRGDITVLELGTVVGDMTSAGNRFGATSIVVPGGTIVFELRIDGKGLMSSSSIEASP